VTALLLDAGADINHRSDAGYTPLAEAVNHGNTAVVALLLERGAGIRGVLIASRSIRALAEALGRHAIVEMLDAEEKKRGGEEAAKLVEKGTAETITVSRSPLKLKPR
jgi:ankyrin repeat protein